MAKLTLTYSDLYTKVSNFLGLTATSTAPTGTNLTTCQDIVARGLRQFLYPIDMRNGKLHEWTFMDKLATLTTSSGKWKYALPDDFSELQSILFFDTNELQPPLKRRDKEQIINMRSDVVSTEWPQYFAVVPCTYDPEIGTMYELWLYPNPDGAYVLNYWYKFDPIKLSATTDLVVGGVRAVEAILETCLAVAEIQEDDNTSTHHQKEAQRLVQTLIIADTITETRNLGNLYSAVREWPPQRQYLVPFQDSNIYASGETTDEFEV